jgi:hypothetical protein
LGAQFNIRAFHDEVLGAGALPMDVLEQHIHSWVTQQKTAAASAAGKSARVK